MIGVERFPDATALGDARAWLRNQVQGSGARCPCCTQFAKVYRRTIGASMARDLVVMHRTAGRAWFYIPELLGYQGGDAAKLRYWSLITPETTTTDGHDDGNRRTRYQVTDVGRAFIAGQSHRPKYALIFDGRLMGLDGSRLVSIHDCLGQRFNLAELLGQAAGEDTPCAF